MKNRTLFRVLTAVFAVLTAICVLIQVFVKPKPYSDIKKDFTYTGNSELALPSDSPETIEQDGEIYTKVIEGEGAPVITVLEKNGTYTESVSFDNLTSKQAPETHEFVIAGKTYTLNLVSADYVENKRTYTATGEIHYDNAWSEPTPPETSEVTYTDESGNVIAVEGNLVALEQVSGGDGTQEVTGPQTKTIRSTVELPEGSNVFIVNGKYVTYDPYNPMWDGYQTDVVAAAGLPSGTKVLSGKWSGAPYVSGSTFCQDIIWTIQTTGTYTTSTAPSYIARYQAVGENPVFNATAVYSGNVKDLGIDESAANGGTYNLSATVTYRLDKVASKNPIVQIISGNKLVMPALIIFNLIGFLASLFVLVFVTKTKSSKWDHSDDDDEDDDDEYDDGYSK